MRNGAKTHCPDGHPLAGENIRWEKRGTGKSRRCRVCQRRAARDSNAKARARRKAEAQ